MGEMDMLLYFCGCLLLRAIWAAFRVFILFTQYFIYSIVHGYIVYCSEKLETICCLKNKRLDYSLPVALILKQYWNNCVEILIDKAK